MGAYRAAEGARPLPPHHPSERLLPVGHSTTRSLLCVNFVRRSTCKNGGIANAKTEVLRFFICRRFQVEWGLLLSPPRFARPRPNQLGRPSLLPLRQFSLLVSILFVYAHAPAPPAQSRSFGGATSGPVSPLFPRLLHPLVRADLGTPPSSCRARDHYCEGPMRAHMSRVQPREEVCVDAHVCIFCGKVGWEGADDYVWEGAARGYVVPRHGRVWRSWE